VLRTQTPQASLSVSPDQCTHTHKHPYHHLWADCLDNMWSLTSHNPIGLYGLLRGQLYFFILFLFFTFFTYSQAVSSLRVRARPFAREVVTTAATSSQVPALHSRIFCAWLQWPRRLRHSHCFWNSNIAYLILCVGLWLVCLCGGSSLTNEMKITERYNIQAFSRKD
jgi:hypothetical protein